MVDLDQPTLTTSVPGKEGVNAPRALISVYDKTGVTAFATALTAMGWKILSTGGTARLRGRPKSAGSLRDERQRAGTCVYRGTVGALC